MAGDVQIKGTRNGLVICLPAADFDDIKRNLEEKLKQAKGFFTGAKFTFRHQERTINEEQQRELEQLLSGYGMIPIPREERHKPILIPKSSPVSTPVPSMGSLPGEPARLVGRSLRSGQKIRYLEGHVVVLGDVHRGAVIEAAGSILIMGRCAGTVHAGVNGDKRAGVVSLEFCSPTLTIAGVQAMEIPSTSIPGFKRVMLKDERIVLAPV
ncbi:septum site-determining protein MinC [Desulforudis sp. 1088]|uniref:septum site-determining protein MinC n=1 Tax=unclassified Candidatus Desulforudis TaxID=2635950 RepID=UPI003469B15F